MIVIKELRIGNWVSYAGATSFGKVEGMVQNVLVNGNSLVDRQIYPIPLTPEILVGCGFVYVENIAHWGNRDDDLSYYQIKLKNGEEMQVFLDYSCNILSHGFELTSLHQLQNLYFALTGEELNIQL